MASAAASPTPPTAVVRPPRERVSSWPLADRLFYGLSWLSGIGLCAIALFIVVFMLIKGLAYLRPSLLWTSPNAGSIHQTQAGGILDPIEGTLLVTAIGTVIATPLGIGVAVWLVEYGRPRALARTVDSAIEMLAGVPSIVLALFGLLFFSQGFLAFLSQPAASGALGESFLTAGATLSLIALPLVFAVHARVARTAAAADPRGLLRARQDEGHDQPLRAAAGGQSKRRRRGRARHGQDHRRHGDHPAAARRQRPAHRTRRPRAGVRAPARDGLHAHELRLLQLALRRGQRPREGIRGRVRPAADGARR